MKRPITIISSICTLLFLTAIIWFAAGIYIDKKNGTIKAEERYSKLLEETKQNFSLNSYGSSEFSNQFIKALGNIDDFSSLKLEINGENVYSYPPNSFQFPTPKLVKTYTDTVYTNSNSFTLTASIYLMSPSSIYNHSRLAFLLILSGTLIAFIFLALLKQPDNDFTIKAFRKKYRQEQFNTDSALKAEETKKEVFISEETENTSEKNEEESENFEESQNETDDLTEIEAQPEENEEVDIIDLFEKENQQLSENQDGIEDNQTEIQQELQFDKTEETSVIPSTEEKMEISETEEDRNISPLTGIYYQNCLEEKLENAVTTSKNNETSLILTKINGLDRGNSLSQNSIAIMQQIFGIDALLFEYKADCYAIILSDIDLNSAVESSEKLYENLSDYLKDNNSTNEVSIGISSVNGRIVKAEQVILEADQALLHATEDPDSPIIAFRANPDKYKEYMNEN